ncbi:MAG: GTP 3',8-cyclase MoaA [Chloroflexi bacterium]|nr:GTP 3',8-cyclase MoaA [Chloroflexota bacterium]
MPDFNTAAQEAPQVVDTLGRPLRDLRISVTDRCNFRCQYCMPAEKYGVRYHFLPRAELLTFEEIVRLTRIFVKLGVSKARITGGEPTVRRDIDQLIGMLAKVEGILDLTLTTNGFLLAQIAEDLKRAGLRRVTVSLDTLDNEVFGRMNGRGFSTHRVLEGIWKAVELGMAPVKVNAVVQRGVNDHTVVDTASYFKGTGIVVRFIEYMDVGNLNGWRLDNIVPSAEVIRRINEVFPLEPAERSYRGEVAERYRYVDGTGEIGVISSVTQPFCGDCTRVRLSPEGKLITCLFASIGHDLRAPLRSGATDEDLEERIKNIWRVRDDRYSELRTSLTPELRKARKIEMYAIGG